MTTASRKIALASPKPNSFDVIAAPAKEAKTTIITAAAAVITRGVDRTGIEPD